MAGGRSHRRRGGAACHPAGRGLEQPSPVVAALLGRPTFVQPPPTAYLLNVCHIFDSQAAPPSRVHCCPPSLTICRIHRRARCAGRRGRPGSRKDARLRARARDCRRRGGGEAAGAATLCGPQRHTRYPIDVAGPELGTSDTRNHGPMTCHAFLLSACGSPRVPDCSCVLCAFVDLRNKVRATCTFNVIFATVIICVTTSAEISRPSVGV